MKNRLMHFLGLNKIKTSDRWTLIYRRQGGIKEFHWNRILDKYEFNQELTPSDKTRSVVCTASTKRQLTLSDLSTRPYILDFSEGERPISIHFDGKEYHIDKDRLRFVKAF